MLKVLQIITLSLLICSVTFARQIKEPRELVEIHCRRMSLEFDFPKRFHEVTFPHTGVFAPRKNTGFLNAVSMHLKSDDADVVIALSFFDLDTAGKTRKTLNDYKDHNQLGGIRYFIGEPPTPQERANGFRMDQDTAKIKYFDQFELKKYGATYGGVANVPMTRKYKGRYEMMKVLFFFKKGKGEVYQYYFYNAGAPTDKIINQTRYMFRFKHSKPD